MNDKTIVLESTKRGEGLSLYPHVDPIVRRKLEKEDPEFLEKLEKKLPYLKLTFGYGTKFPIVEKEANVFLHMRMTAMIEEIKINKPFFNHMPLEVQNVIVEMAYMLGVPRLMKFYKTWKFLELHEFKKASVEMLDSKWWRELHRLDMLDGVDSIDRAERLSIRMAEAET